MKKLILLPLLSIALFSCKKTTSMQENTSENKEHQHTLLYTIQYVV